MSTPENPQDPYGQQPAGGYSAPQGGYNAPQGGFNAPPPPAYNAGAAQGAPPPNYLVWAIISVFLCWPLAIPAIIFSTQVNTKWAQGDAAGAHESSRKAKQFSLWATIAGVVGTILYIALIAAGVVAGAGTSGY